jgi:signal transduction histidine kinase
VRIEIRDSGAGFNPDGVSKLGRGSGITGMRERAIALGGDLDISSSPGQGTRVTASLPLSGILERRKEKGRR